MSQNVPEDHRTASITIIDGMKLRRAALSSFLQDWADSNSMNVLPLEADLLRTDANKATYKMAILNIGGSAVESPATKRMITQVLDSAPHIPLVILADSGDPEQVISAFRVGARGFIPVEMDPSIALKALSFILSGGTFFPPSALAQSAQSLSTEHEDMVHSEQPRKSNDCTASVALTRRQQQVLQLLRMGKSNKTIAQELGMHEPTVKVHVRQILRKFNASNRTQVAVRAGQRPAVALPPATDGAMFIHLPTALIGSERNKPE